MLVLPRKTARAPRTVVAAKRSLQDAGALVYAHHERRTSTGRLTTFANKFSLRDEAWQRENIPVESTKNDGRNQVVTDTSPAFAQI